jgi:hypothetical protein
MLGTGLIGLFYTRTLHGQRNRDRVHVVYSRSEERATSFCKAISSDSNPSLAALAAGAVFVTQEDMSDVLGCHFPVDALDLTGVGVGLDGAGRDVAHRMDGEEIGEDLGDAASRDPAGQIEPVRADVGNGAQRAAQFGIEPPVPVGRLVQPVLDVGAVAVSDRADVAAPNALTRLVEERIEADVVVRAVHEPARLGKLQQLA